MNLAHRKTKNGKISYSKTPNSCKKILEQKKDGKFERIVSLEELSFAITRHFKIEAPYW
jgi:hypothetical protein